MSLPPVIKGVGDTLVLPFAFSNPLTGSPVSPDVVVCRVRPPGGATTVYTYGIDSAMAQSSLGNYTITLYLGTVGKWLFRPISTGRLISAPIEDQVVMVNGTET